MNGELGSFAQFGSNGDISPMAGDDLFANGKAQPRTRNFPCGGFHPVELIKNMGKGFLRDAHTGVAYGQPPLVLIETSQDAHRAPGNVVLDGIADQAKKDLLDFFAICLHNGEILREFEADADLVLFSLALQGEGS